MRRVLLLVTSLAVSLFAAELVLRWTDAVDYRPLPPALDVDVRGGGRLLHQASSTDGLYYELAPNLSTRWRRWRINTNSFGMRDREPLEESPGLVRIAVVGDSFAFGWAVNMEGAFPDILERLLNEDAPPGVQFDVLNFGVSGYSSRDEAIVLRQKVMQWKPQVVVLGYVLNDPETSPLQPLPNAFAPVEWWQHSHLLRLLAQARWEWKIKRLGDGDYHRYLYADAERWGSVVTAFDDIRRTADEMGAPVVLTVFPRIPPPAGSWDNYLYTDVLEQVDELGRRNGFVVVDLYPRFSRERPKKFGVTNEDRHPNAFGHYLAARAIEYRLQHELADKIVPSSSDAG